MKAEIGSLWLNGRTQVCISNGKPVLPLEYDDICLMEGEQGKAAYLVKEDQTCYYFEDGNLEKTKLTQR